MVYPSGAERTSCALASVVPAPGLDSMITGWPSTLESPSAAMRAFASAPPPGANPCNIVIGRSGHAACAAYGTTLLAEKPARSPRLLIMAVLPSMIDGSRALERREDALRISARTNFVLRQAARR